MASKEDPKEFYSSKLAWKAYKDGFLGGPDLEADRSIANHTFSAQWVTPDDLCYGSPLVDSKDITWDQQIRRGFFWISVQAHLTLIDPQGRRTGFDPMTGQSVNDIPGAVYLAPPDAIVETVTGIDVGDGWQIVVTGFDSGDYILESGYVDNRTIIQVTPGSTYQGKTETFAVRDPIFGVYLPLIDARSLTSCDSERVGQEHRRRSGFGLSPPAQTRLASRAHQSSPGFAHHPHFPANRFPGYRWLSPVDEHYTPWCRYARGGGAIALSRRCHSHGPSTGDLRVAPAPGAAYAYSRTWRLAERRV